MASKELFWGENELTELKKEVAVAQDNLIQELNAIRHAIDENDIDQANLAAIGYQTRTVLKNQHSLNLSLFKKATCS